MSTLHVQNVLARSHSELNSDISSEIIQQIDLIYSKLMNAGIPVRPYTPKSVQILQSLDELKKMKILANLQDWISILSSTESALDDVDETSLVDRALSHFNFKLKDHNWDEIQRDEIIEIYGSEGIQLYRSLNFFKTCGYSLLDLCVNEWFILWERPKAVLDVMSSVSQAVMNGTKKDSAFNVPPHLIRETYDDGTTQPFLPRAAIVEFQRIYPAYDDSFKYIVGVVVTSKGKLISVGDDALKMGFI